MSTTRPTDNDPAEVDGTSDSTMQELLTSCVEHVKNLNEIIHQEMRDKPDFVNGWDAIMQEYADVFAEHDRKAEEAALDREIDEWMSRIDADFNRLSGLDPTDLEFDEIIARALDSFREADAVMRLRCRQYPDKLAKWEEEVMAPVKELGAVFAASMEAEEVKPGN